MREIAEAYDARRAEILGRIERRECSASMSGIEYYHKPWADLDMGDALDRDTIVARLTYASRPSPTDDDASLLGGLPCQS